MKYKTKSGVEVDLTQEDAKEIAALYKISGPEKFEDMKEYFVDLHKHAVQKMEHISDHIITDEDSIDIAMEYVAKNGTYNDFVKMLRYEMDYNLAYHTLESSK
jgi:hypothetical protein